MPRKSTSPWSLALIVSRRKEILESFSHLGNLPADRLKQILSSTSALSDDLDSDSLLSRYTLTIFALLHHQQHGGLSTSQFRSISKLAHTILRVAGIKYSPTAKLGFLYGDIHLARSQVFRREGDHWAAAWEQQIASFYSRRDEVNGPGQQNLGKAIRLQRQGYCSAASKYYKIAQSHQLSERQRTLCMIGIVRSLRLSRSLVDTPPLIEVPTNSKYNVEPEILWEETCASAMSTGCLKKLINLVKNSTPHQGDAYFLEVYLWAASLQKRTFLDEFSSKPLLTAFRKTARNSSKNHNSTTLRSYSELLDAQKPFPLRLKSAGDLIQNRHKLRSIELEVLLLAAVARWLIRNKQRELADICLREYEELSRRAYEGKDLFSLNFY